MPDVNYPYYGRPPEPSAENPVPPQPPGYYPALAAVALLLSLLALIIALLS